jgi:hypothetical protein
MLIWQMPFRYFVTLRKKSTAMKILYFISTLLCMASVATAQVPGCTDPLSRNFNPNATVNDGSCLYNSASVAAASTVELPVTVNETSGLVLWDNNLYTHNDNTDVNLYRLNTTTGVVAQTLQVAGTSNQDWEDIAQDENYIYIAETGNNVSGNRTNLRIIRADKAGLQLGTPTVNSINFTYSNQTDLTPTANNQTDFDCEAIIVGSDAIYLFTKQWVSRQTSVYSLPKTPGTHVAQLLTTFNVNGLVTGATSVEDKNLVVLCGYSTTLQPFIYLLYDFTGNDFFGGNKRKLNLSLSFHQIEGIETNNGSDYYLTNENFQQAIFSTTQRLHTVSLAPYLADYLQTLNTPESVNLKDAGISFYPNPALDSITIQCPQKVVGSQYSILDATGRQVQSGKLTNTTTQVDVATLSPAVYTIVINGFENDDFKLIKK